VSALNRKSDDGKLRYELVLAIKRASLDKCWSMVGLLLHNTLNASAYEASVVIRDIEQHLLRVAPWKTDKHGKLSALQCDESRKAAEEEFARLDDLTAKLVSAVDVLRHDVQMAKETYEKALAMGNAAKEVTK